MKPHHLLLIMLSLALTFEAARAQDSRNALTPLEQGLLLRAKADTGDADAMFKLATLLLEHAPTPKRPGKMCDGKPVNPLVKPKPGANCVVVQDEANAALMEQWKAVGTKYTATTWINKAAEHGQREAMALLCRMGSDAAAPAAAREQGAEWCRRMRMNGS